MPHTDAVNSQTVAFTVTFLLFYQNMSITYKVRGFEFLGLLPQFPCDSALGRVDPIGPTLHEAENCEYSFKMTEESTHVPPGSF